MKLLIITALLAAAITAEPDKAGRLPDPGQRIGINFRSDSVDLVLEGNPRRLKVFFGNDSTSPENLIIYPYDESAFAIINDFRFEKRAQDTLFLSGMLCRYHTTKIEALDRASPVSIACPAAAVKDILLPSTMKQRIKERPLVWGGGALLALFLVWRYIQVE